MRARLTAPWPGLTTFWRGTGSNQPKNPPTKSISEFLDNFSHIFNFNHFQSHLRSYRYANLQPTLTRHAICDARAAERHC
jgi:hypothetical protein